MKLYLDENLSPRIAQLLRSKGIDAVSAHEVARTGLDDRAQLRWASRDGRALVTCDVVDFHALAAEAVAASTLHAGIVIIPSSMPTDAFANIGRALGANVARYPAGIPGLLLYARGVPE